MPVNRSPKKLIALVLVGATVAAATEISTGAVGAHPGARAVSATTSSQGNPNAVPPILRTARPSELAEIRQAEAQEAAAFSYHLPPTARYSNAEMNAYPTVHK
jgi:hypothetical protein